VHIEQISCTNCVRDLINFSVVDAGLRIARLGVMQGVVRSTLVIGLVACTNSHVSSPPDAGDTGNSGIAIPWSTSPTIPGAIGSNATITSMTFRIDSLRVVGDAGTTNTLGNLELEWGSGEMPPPTVFSDAPSGLYSKVVLHADGELLDYSWEIAGTVAMSDGTHAFSIHDLMPLSVTIDTSATLDPGGMVTLGVTFQMDEPFDGLDFTSLELETGGTLVLDTDDAQMADFRTKLQQAIVPSDH
jgi:hypothetical protein